MPRDAHDILTSLPLEILLYFNQYFTILYVVLTVGQLVYKDYKYPYPGSTSVVEALFAIFYIFVDRSRLYIGSKGNKTEQILPMLLFDLLCVPIIITNVYYLSLQTYVTRLDIVLGSLALTFIGLEIALGLLATLSFLRHKNG